MPGWVMSALMAAGPGGLLGAEADAGAASKPAEESKLRFPTYGVALTAPSGWKRIPEGGGWEMARWTPADRAGRAFLIVEVHDAGKRSLDEWARSFAQETKAGVEPAKEGLAGERTLRLVVPGQHAGFWPRSGLMAVHGPCMVLVYVVADRAEGAEAAVEDLRRGWTWIKMEHPDEHLQPASRAVAVLGGLAVLRMPEVVRPMVERNPSRDNMMLHIYDHVAGRPGIVIDIQKVPKSPEVSPQDVLNGWGRAMADRLKLDQPPKITAKHDAPFRAILEPLIVPLPEGTVPPGGEKMTTRYAVIFPSAESLLSITFTFPPNTPEATQAYYKLAERIIQSASVPGPTTAPGPDAAKLTGPEQPDSKPVPGPPPGR